MARRPNPDFAAGRGPAAGWRTAAPPLAARDAAGSPPAPAVAELASVLEAGGARLEQMLCATERRLEEIAAACGPALGPPTQATLSAGGKRLRPMLVFLCAGVAGGAERADGPGPAGGVERALGGELVRAGAAVELLHMATLVHDDVLDRASLRRGRPTVYASSGREAATATGDLLFSRAFAELALTGSRRAVSALASAGSALARGELMQRADAWSDGVTEARYLERCELKTARLFEAAGRLGAILGDRRSDRAEELGFFAGRIGLAFQIFDDVLDVSGGADRTGKRRGADLLDGTITLPLILARGRDDVLRRLDLRSDVTRPAQAEAVCDRIAATGALGSARERALGYVEEAKGALAGLELPHGQRRALELVADGVVERYA